ncbi:MAG: PQQ-binding-like beta-propeller repeat protein [Phycisphaerae bacterium]|nr:PQQ-binding-like beta-propeller repeat protein [Phycisphaerae bacterium]
MTETSDNTTNRRERWYRAVAATAGVAGAVALAVSALLVLFVLRGYGDHPLDSPRWAALKAELARTPRDDPAARAALVKRLRTLDAELRTAYFARRRRLAIGAYVVCAAAGAALAAGAIALRLRRRPARVAGAAPNRERAERAARRGRLAVAACGVGLAAVGVAGVAAIPAPRTLSPPSRPPVRPVEVATVEQTPWARFRGPGGRGVVVHRNVPTDWNAPAGENILWRSDAIPLPGKSSPIVWAKRVFLTGGTSEQREVYCLDADTGQRLWTRTVPAGGRSPEFDESMGTGWAASTPVTDGRYVCAIFPTGDLVCFDFDGQRRWHRNLGTPDSAYGFATSLVMHDGRLIVQYDQYDDAFDADKPGTWRSRLLLLDPASGETLASVPRPVTDSWTTPVVAELAGREQLITVGNPLVIAHDPADGRILWQADAGGPDVAPSPVVLGDRVIVAVPNAYVFALRGAVELSDGRQRVIWQANEVTPTICSPVSDGRRVFALSSWGTLACYDAATGEAQWLRDFGGQQFNASPSLVGETLHLTDTQGVTYVVSTGPFDFDDTAAVDANDGEPVVGGIVQDPTTGKRIAAPVRTCPLGEAVYGSPAFQDGRIYIRGRTHVYCIADAEHTQETP